MKGAVQESKTALRFRVQGESGQGTWPLYFATHPEACSFAIVSSAATHRNVLIDVLCPTRAAAKKYAGELGVKKFDAMAKRGGVPEVFERYRLLPVEYIDDIDERRARR